MGMPLEPSHSQPNGHVDNWQKPQSSSPKEWFPLRLLGLQVLQPALGHNCSLIISLPPLALETSQEFQIWYSVDLFKWGYGVNGFEKTCVAVYGLYVSVVTQITKYIEEESAKIGVHAFITSILDSCNSLLYGLPKHLLWRLQSV